MTPAEAAILLSKAAAVEGREVSESSARMWAEILPDVTLADALEWLPRHYREETRWLMPKHVLDGVTALQVDRIRTVLREYRKLMLSKPVQDRATDKEIVLFEDKVAQIRAANPLGAAFLESERKRAESDRWD